MLVVCWCFCDIQYIAHTHTRSFNEHFSMTTWIHRYKHCIKALKACSQRSMSNIITNILIALLLLLLFLLLLA